MRDGSLQLPFLFTSVLVSLPMSVWSTFAEDEVQMSTHGHQMLQLHHSWSGSWGRTPGCRCQHCCPHGKVQSRCSGASDPSAVAQPGSHQPLSCWSSPEASWEQHWEVLMDGQEVPPASELLLYPDKGQGTMLQCWQPPPTSLEQHLELPAPVLEPQHRHWEGNVWPSPLHLELLQLPLPTGGSGCTQIQQQ